MSSAGDLFSFGTPSFSNHRGFPVAVSSRTTSPGGQSVSTGLSEASKKPRWTVVGDAFSS